MNVNAREKRFLFAAGIVAALLVVYLLVGLPAVRKWRAAGEACREAQAGFAAAKLQVDAQQSRHAELEQLAGKLRITLPTDGSDGQRESFVHRIEELARQSGTRITALAPAAAEGRRRTAPPAVGDALGYRVSCETTQAGLIGFLSALEELERPVVFQGLDVKDNPQTPDKLAVTLEFYTYVFDGANS